jgi:hypothetical protein
MKAWSHVAMLLLGVTLAVGFYEGRRLVTNTMRALRVGDGTPGLAVRLDPDAADGKAEDARRGGRNASRKGGRSAEPASIADEDRAAALRERLRARGIETDRSPSAGLARAPRVPSTVDHELAMPADPLEDDTGEPAP